MPEHQPDAPGDGGEEDDLRGDVQGQPVIPGRDEQGVAERLALHPGGVRNELLERDDRRGRLFGNLQKRPRRSTLQQQRRHLDQHDERGKKRQRDADLAVDAWRFRPPPPQPNRECGRLGDFHKVSTEVYKSNYNKKFTRMV